MVRPVLRAAALVLATSCGASPDAATLARTLVGPAEASGQDAGTEPGLDPDWALFVAALAAGGGAIFDLADDADWVADAGPVLALVLSDRSDLCDRLALGRFAEGIQLGLWAREVGDDGRARAPSAGTYAIEPNHHGSFAGPPGGLPAVEAPAPSAWSTAAALPFWWPPPPGQASADALAPGRRAGAVVLARGEVPTRACRPCAAAAAAAARRRPGDVPAGTLVLGAVPTAASGAAAHLAGRLTVRLAAAPSAQVSQAFTATRCAALGAAGRRPGRPPGP